MKKYFANSVSEAAISRHECVEMPALASFEG